MFKFEMPGRKFIGGFVAGTLWGVALTVIAMTLYLRHSLVLEYECKEDVAASVQKIKENVARMPAWTIQQAGCFTPSTPEGGKVDTLRLCNANYVKLLIADPADRRIAAVLPCAVAVYGKPDGKTYISRLNMPLVARILGGTPALVFPEVIAPEQRYMLGGVLKGK
jgi:hypothetical protein